MYLRAPRQIRADIELGGEVLEAQPRAVQSVRGQLERQRAHLVTTSSLSEAGLGITSKDQMTKGLGVDHGLAFRFPLVFS